MTFREQKRNVCFFIAFMMFLTGVCSGVLQADSSVLHDTSAAANLSLKASANLLEEEVCTSEMLGHLEAIREIRAKNDAGFSDRTVRNKTNCFLPGVAAGASASVFFGVLQNICEKVWDNTAIVNFIHNQDGKKK